MDCLFCKIINKEIPSYTIYEDELVKVFLDINPTSNGHMLIVPKKHYENMLDIDDKLMSHIHKISIKMYKLLKEKLDIDGLTLVQNNMYGQDVKHYHLHLIPRYNKDELKISNNKNNLVNPEDVFEQIKN